MDFQLLGAVELRGRTGRADLGPAQQRCLLAALALQAGHSVPTETLIEQVWGPGPNGDLRSSLHGHVARLRRTLREAGGDLRTTSEGYRLDVPPDQVDVHRFTSLLRAAQGPDRRDSLREALDQWHGEPLAGLAGDWAEQVRAGLHRQHLRALTEWASIELAEGRSAEVIARAGAALELYPVSEQLVGCYLRALHMSGRTAEALALYESTRARLREELNTQPGEDLREIHLWLLREERRPRPAQLPPVCAGFTGRERELAWLDTESRRNVAVLTGIGGVGKTALAVRWAHGTAARFPDGQLYVDMWGRSAEDVLPSFQRALGTVEPFGTALAQRRILILLDNVRSLDQVRPFVPASGQSLTVVTSRRRLGLAAELVLGPLRAKDSVRLLAGFSGTGREAAEIAELCGHFPLALRIAAATLAEYPGYDLGSYAARLREQQSLPETLDGAVSIRDTFAESVARLEEPERRMFRLLGRSAEPSFCADTAAALAGIPVADALRLLEGLVTANLLTRSGDRFGFEDLIRRYAANA